MNSSRYLCDLRNILAAEAERQGFCRFGVAELQKVDPADSASYMSHIAAGRHAQMDYMTRYQDIRENPALLLEGAHAASVIAVASSYYTDTPQPVLRWARYALGDDYHTAVRNHLQPLAEILASAGFEARICVDTAPLREKYWAAKAGLGTIGKNTLLLTPCGSYVLLGFIITDAPLPPDSPMTESLCPAECDACLKACPGKALTVLENGQTANDARRCNSYLTIEHRGDLPQGLRLGKRIYGCDICQEVCPVNRSPAMTRWVEFTPRASVLSLTRGQIADMTQEQFSTLFRNSAIKRTKLAGLKRNAGI